MATLEERSDKHIARAEMCREASVRIRRQDIRDEPDPVKKAELAIGYLVQSGHPNNKEIHEDVRVGFNVLHDMVKHMRAYVT